jgi:hypothetical protein
MIIKFKNGYSVKIADSAGKSKEELIALAKKAVMKCQDAVSLERDPNTRVSFMITKIKEGIKNSDDKILKREWEYLTRDIMADYTDAHMKNYPKIYRQEILDKIIKQYRDALDQFDKVDGGFDVDVYRNYVDNIANAWNVGVSKEQKTQAVAGHVKFKNGDAVENQYPSTAAAVNDIIKNIGKLEKKHGPVDGWYVMDLHTGEILADGGDYDLRTTDSETATDAYEIPPYRVKITYANGEVTIKYVEDLTAAVRDIRHRIEVGKKDGNEVAVALVFDSMTDEIVLSSDTDEDIKIKDAAGDMNDPEVIGYIEYVDIPAKEKRFSNIKQAREELQKLLQYAKRVGEPVAKALILNADTEDVVEEVYRNKDIEIKDVPYYDPTDYGVIKSSYSTERIGREARHKASGPDPIMSELDEVIDEIDELIKQGTNALVNAGWSKDDARHAIAYKYGALEKELRRNKLIDEARKLHKKIRELEKAWDLRV